MDSYERVHEYLSKLGMSTMESIIDSYLETSHDRPVMDILDHLLSEELKHKLSIVDMPSFERYSCTLSYESIMPPPRISSGPLSQRPGNTRRNSPLLLLSEGLRSVPSSLISFLFLLEWHDRQQCRNRSLSL